MHDIAYWIAFNHLEGITSKHLLALHAYFGKMERAWHASYAELMRCGLRETAVEAIVAGRGERDPATLAESIERQGIAALSFTPPDYPPLLKEIADPPAILYARGDTDILHNTCLAVVGTRKASPYGTQVMQRFAAALAQYSITIVSGLAFGIDALAHRAALAAGVPTIAVLGGGVDDASIGPRNHAPLAHEILRQDGTIISEYAPCTASQPYHFPERNRIIAGLSKGTLVVEAGLKSGSLITAHLALDYNREVYAIPGSIFSPVSHGTHALLKEGAIPITDMEELFVLLGVSNTAKKNGYATKPNLPPEHGRIFSLLTHEPQLPDMLAQAAGVTFAELNGILTALELRGLVQSSGGRYLLTGKTK